MRSLSEILLEKLKVTNKVTNTEPSNCTLEEFLVWYYFDNTQPIEDLQFDEFCCTDFDPDALEEYFDNDNRKLYRFLMDRLDDEIELHIIEDATGHYEYYSFYIDNICFTVEITSGKFWKK